MILKAENLTKIYKHNDGPVHALDNINIEVSAGSFVTVTGASGSGKTTLLLALSGLIRPSSGSIVYDQMNMDKASDKQLALYRRKHIGFVMQNFSLIPYLTAFQNVMVPLSLQKLSKKDQKIKAEAVLTMVGLENRQNHLPRELSSGQQQRVSIARALVNDPSIIFADEPTGNLDPGLSLEILELIKMVNQQKSITIIMVTHSPLAAEFGNCRIHLKDGKLN